MTGFYLSLSVFVLLCMGSILPGIGAVTNANANAAPTMGAVCAECHETMASFEQTYHGRAWKGLGLDKSCQSCHGSTEAHVNDPSLESIFSFSKDGKRSIAEQNSGCLSCHSDTSMLSYWDVSAHNRNDVACVSCHTIHSDRSSVDQLKVCVTCHRSQRGEMNKRSHHPLKEGKIQCSDCHNPHGTQSAHSMIKAENVNQLCYQCHPDKRGPYIYEHPPVEENCTICHTPHGSRHSKLLAEKVPNLCQDCHDWSRHPGTPYDAKTGFTGSSPSNRFFSRSCLNCHGAIHGSTSFENHAFTR